MDRPEGFSSQKPSPTKSRRQPSVTPRTQTATQEKKAATAARVRAEKQELNSFTHASRLRKRRWALSLGSVGALLGGVVLLTLSPALSLHTVVIEGAERLEPGDIAEALNPLQGVPLARVSTERVGAALASITLIQAFETRIVPPGTLVVTISERKPIGAVSSNSTYTVVDAAGVELWDTPAPPSGFPLILVAADAESPSFISISRVLLALPEELLTQVEGVTATTLDDVRFTIRGASHEVVWGSSDRVLEKARVLTAALRAAGSDTSQIIDVTTPDSLVIRSKG